MKKVVYCLFVSLLAVVLNGCRTSPYEYGTNWLIRENDIPQFYSRFDLFYIGKAPADYGDTHDIQFNWTKTHTNDISAEGSGSLLLRSRRPRKKMSARLLSFSLIISTNPAILSYCLQRGKGQI